jgi:methyl-accepting chemotaxis protein
LSISLGITIIAIVSILGYIIIQSIMRNIGIFMNGFERLSQGDLTSTIEHASRDEYNILIRQYNDFVGKISGILLSVKSNASNLAVSSDKMNGIITTFSDSTHQQASLSEEINSSMTQISNEMQNITDATSFQSECLGSLIQIINELSEIIKIMNARMSESLVTVNNISEDARAGEEMLERMKSSMHHIGKSSEEITSIVSIINDISDQINLLSLNAAIEAARAGDSGRGFAVVAHEITKLAARTAESISNIDNLIQHNKSETKQAIVRVSESSDRIRKIMTGVNGINGMIQSINQLMSQQSNINIKVHDEAEKVRLRDAEIQSAVAEQQKGIDEITSSIGHIANLTQASSFGIMEIAENILSLRQMSSDLFGEITNFRIMK